MGNFYVNYTLKTSAQHEVIRALAGRAAYVTPARNGYIVVFDKEADEQDAEQFETLGAKLSQQLQCPVLVVLNHDDDIFWYTLFQGGAEIDSYDSAPDYYNSSESLPPEGGNAQQLCATFGSTNITEVEQILRKPSDDDDSYVFQYERHLDLVNALGLPDFAVGAGFTYIAEGLIPEGLTAADLVKLP